MFQRIFVVLSVLILTTTAFATKDGPYEGDVAVSLTIPVETKIWYQGSEVMVIEFSSTLGTDSYRATAGGLIGFYTATDVASKVATDAWASNYYESDDFAEIWMYSNVDLTGSLVTSGDLNDGFGHTIPTWFTINAHGYEKSLHIPDPNGFRLGNAPGGYVADGVIPGEGQGGYAGDGDQVGEDVAGPVTPIFFGNQAFYPNQDAFRLSTASGSTFDLDAPVGPGKLKFKSRCLRNGMSDAAGPYMTTITATFIATP
jgi:hypothetical protein